MDSTAVLGMLPALPSSMASGSSSGYRSPPNAPSPSFATRPRFDNDLLRGYMKFLLASTFQGATWPGQKDRERVKRWIKEIGDRVKERMLEIQPKGFKYVVFTQINENLGQGGRADMVCHWEDGDVIIQEMFVNDTLICVCIALALG